MKSIGAREDAYDVLHIAIADTAQLNGNRLLELGRGDRAGICRRQTAQFHHRLTAFIGDTVEKDRAVFRVHVVLPALIHVLPVFSPDSEVHDGSLLVECIHFRKGLFEIILKWNCENGSNAEGTPRS